VLGTPSAAKAEEESAETGIDRSGWIAKGVAYIGFEQFPASKGSLTALREFLESHASARALIIDVRTHGGGYTDEVDLLASYIFDRPTELIYEDTRAAAFRHKPDTATLKRIAGPKGFVRQVHVAAPNAIASNLRQARVYVLTSGYTGSAAEHLTLALKQTGRATVIGETTAGMGHFGRVIELPAGFFAFIPIGRPSDPATGIGWECIGIKPHLEVPARKALETALLRLGFASEQAQAQGKKWTPSGEMERVIPLRAKPL
jgi:C-terminal processing protease CtpA/Prc